MLKKMLILLIGLFCAHYSLCRASLTTLFRKNTQNSKALYKKIVPFLQVGYTVLKENPAEIDLFDEKTDTYVRITPCSLDPSKAVYTIPAPEQHKTQAFIF